MAKKTATNRRKSSKNRKSRKSFRGGAYEQIYNNTDLEKSKSWADKWQVIKIERKVLDNINTAKDAEPYVGNSEYEVFAL
jgi:hypothetical protein